MARMLPTFLLRVSEFGLVAPCFGRAAAETCTTSAGLDVIPPRKREACLRCSMSFCPHEHICIDSSL